MEIRYDYKSVWCLLEVKQSEEHTIIVCQ